MHTIHVVTATITVSNSQSTGSATASCASGEVVLGGGVATTTSGYSVRVSRPSATTDNPSGWYGEIRSGFNGSATGTVYALCMAP